MISYKCATERQAAKKSWSAFKLDFKLLYMPTIPDLLINHGDQQLLRYAARHRFKDLIRSKESYLNILCGKEKCK